MLKALQSDNYDECTTFAKRRYVRAKALQPKGIVKRNKIFFGKIDEGENLSEEMRELMIMPGAPDAPDRYY